MGPHSWSGCAITVLPVAVTTPRPSKASQRTSRLQRRGLDYAILVAAVWRIVETAYDEPALKGAEATDHLLTKCELRTCEFLHGDHDIAEPVRRTWRHLFEVSLSVMTSFALGSDQRDMSPANARVTTSPPS